MADHLDENATDADLIPTRAEEPAPGQVLEPGTRIGRFELGPQLGIGGMGTVYRASDSASGQVVALKTLGSDVSPTARRRFRIEAKAAMRLRHPHICPVLEVGSAGEVDFIAMQLVTGQELDTWFRDGGVETARLLSTLADVVDALGHAHRLGIVHRDIKPANILVTSDGHAYLMDFGLARDLAIGGGATMTDQAVGTPPYMAPEQACNESELISPPTDIWAVGAVLYELLTERLPFAGNTIYETFKSIVEDEPVPPRQFNAAIDVDLERLVLRCLRKEPARRYPSAEELAIDLRAIAAGERLRYRTSILSEIARFRGWAWILPPLAALVLVLALTLVMRGSSLLAILCIAVLPVLWALRERVRARRFERQAREHQRRLGTLRRQLAESEARDWAQAYAADFGDPAALDAWRFDGGRALLVDGVLIRSDGAPMRSWLRRRINGDFRMTVRAAQPRSPTADITLVAAAQVELESTGYELKIGGYNNTLDLLIRDGQRLWERQAETLEPGRSYTLELERVGKLVTARLDGATLVSLLDDAPVYGRCFGLFGWESETHIAAVSIAVLGLPGKVDLLDVTERYIKADNLPAARALLEDAAQHLLDPHRQLRLAQLQTLLDEHLERQRALPRARTAIETAIPGARVCIQHDGLGVDLRELSGRRVDLGPLRGERVVELFAHGRACTDLAPLADCRTLRRLHANLVAATDFAPVASPELQVLNADYSGIRSLAGFERCPLRDLRVADSSITDLTPVAGCPISSLSLIQSAVRDLGVLRRLPLQQLLLADIPCPRLPPLDLARLTTVNLHGTGFTGLEDLTSHPLQYLDLSGCPIGDLEPLRRMEPFYLDVSDTGVSDLDPVLSTRLRHLILTGLTQLRLPDDTDVQLETIVCGDAPFAEPGFLRHRPPACLTLDRPEIPTWARELLPGWLATDLDPKLARTVAIWSALAADDHDRLRSMAQPVARRQLLPLGLETTQAIASELAATCGAVLVCPDSPELVDGLRTLTTRSVWIGLTGEADGTNLWATGAPFDWHQPVLNGGLREAGATYATTGGWMRVSVPSHALVVLEWPG